MPRVTLYADKYIDADAVAFIEGKTRERGLTDTDIAKVIGITQSSYSNRKRKGKLNLTYLELVKIIHKLELTDEDISKLMRGKVRA